MTRTAVFLLSVVFSQAVFSAAPIVSPLTSDPVEVLDEQGKMVQELPLKDVPKNPMSVLQYNEALDLVQVEMQGKKIWLDTVTLDINPPLSKVVSLPCQNMTKSQARDSENNSTIGFGAGCSK